MAVQTGQIILDTKVLDRIALTMNSSTDRVLRGIAHEVEAEVKNSMHGGGTPHRPSAPGTPPNIDQAALYDGIMVEKIEEGLYHVRDSVEYGAAHELGTSRLPKRPFMVPAVERVSKFVEQRWKGLIR